MSACAAFEQKTSAVIEYYREHGNRFAEVDGDRPIDEVTQSIRETLLRLRHHPEKLKGRFYDSRA